MKMDEKDLIKKLKKVGKQEFIMPKNKAIIKYSLMDKIEKNIFSFLKLAPVFTFIFITAAVSVYMRIDSNSKQSINNDLGGIWCTYDDHYSGGNQLSGHLLQQKEKTIL